MRHRINKYWPVFGNKNIFCLFYRMADNRFTRKLMNSELTGSTPITSSMIDEFKKQLLDNINFIHFFIDRLDSEDEDEDDRSLPNRAYRQVYDITNTLNSTNFAGESLYDKKTYLIEKIKITMALKEEILALEQNRFLLRNKLQSLIIELNEFKNRRNSISGSHIQEYDNDIDNISNLINNFDIGSQYASTQLNNIEKSINKMYSKNYEASRAYGKSKINVLF